MKARRVLVADDHPLAREGIVLALRHALPDAVIACAGSIAEAEREAAEPPAAIGGAFQLVLLDLMLPDVRGFSGFLRLQFRLPEVPIVLITAHHDAATIALARSMGAAGFLLKSEPLDAIAHALRRIVAGERVFPAIDATARAHAENAAALHQRLKVLSSAQRRVLFALADGRANKQIAHDLAITEATVKAHLTAIFRHIGVSNRMQAMLLLQPLLGSVTA